jgi:hypothetical protein
MRYPPSSSHVVYGSNASFVILPELECTLYIVNCNNWRFISAQRTTFFYMWWCVRQWILTRTTHVHGAELIPQYWSAVQILRIPLPLTPTRFIASQILFYAYLRVGRGWRPWRRLQPKTIACLSDSKTVSDAAQSVLSRLSRWLLPDGWR